MSYDIEDVVEALYEAALGRPSDIVGKTEYCNAIRRGGRELIDIAREIYSSTERHQRDRWFGISDHSQFGEFSKTLRHLVRRGTNHGVVVDVGARGRDRSNSFDLLSGFGWKGLLIEANPALYESIEADFSGTDFELVKCAIGVSEGMLPFYIGSNDDVSSLLPDHAAGWGDIRGSVNVPVRRLQDVLTATGIPDDFDLLSLDIEGMDVAVLNDLIGNSKYRPNYIIIEASYDFLTRSLKEVGCSSRVIFNYIIVDQTNANLILCHV
jgi:FkbM family methyltransferase